MLKVLRRIVQEVTSSPDLKSALYSLVTGVQRAVDTEAVSVFLIDNQTDEYVLMATQGLNQTAVGDVRLPLNKGLIGLIGRREEPLNVEDASMHPEFYE